VKREVIICPVCASNVTMKPSTKYKGAFTWWCPKCNRTIIGKSTLVEVGHDKESKET